MPQLTKLELPGDHAHGCRVNTIMPTPSWPEEENSVWCMLSHSHPQRQEVPVISNRVGEHTQLLNVLSTEYPEFGEKTL